MNAYESTIIWQLRKQYIIVGSSVAIAFKEKRTHDGIKVKCGLQRHFLIQILFLIYNLYFPTYFQFVTYENINGIRDISFPLFSLVFFWCVRMCRVNLMYLVDERALMSLSAVI